jgi:hypothetical protein
LRFSSIAEKTSPNIGLAESNLRGTYRANDVDSAIASFGSTDRTFDIAVTAAADSGLPA